ncbi:MAG: hypothetical protein FH753_06345 [Firmicutes bacterium]|nr:hypothetical protein [Bacillota bacterium]
MGCIFRYGHSPFTFMGMGGGFMGILFIIAIGVFLYFILKNNKKNDYNKDDRAINILKEKYAKGEIEEEEFKRRLELLKY